VCGVAFRYLTQPISIGVMRLRNRMVQPGMGTNLTNLDGTVSDAIVEYYARRANTGIGLIITEVCCPEARGKVIPGELACTGLGYIPGLGRLVRAAHSGGAKIALQIAHGGCFAGEAITGQQPVSPSGIGTFLLPDDKPVALTIAEIEELIQAYAATAERAGIAGFDAVEIHGAHGYLPLQFLSGYTNRRTDKYGGSLENRARFCLEIIKAVKERAGQDYPVIYRLSAEEDVPGGITLEEAVGFARMAENWGADAIHVTAGTWDSRMEKFANVLNGAQVAAGSRLSEGVSIGVWVPPHYVPRGNLIRLAAAIKQHVSIPVIAVCGISPEMGEEVIAQKQADLISFGRQMIADPDMPKKVLENRPQSIRRCVRCNECLGSVLSYKGLVCAVNAEAGQEHESFVKPTTPERPKNIMVIGGGPAGMEAARVAALRGHQVTLYDKEKRLGGMLRYGAIPEFKQDYRQFLDWQIAELGRLRVTVKLGCEVTPEMVAVEAPDAVVVATGGKMLVPPIDGIDQPNVFNALDVLDGRIPPEDRVVVCGAGFVGCETAMYLAESYGKKVVLVDQLPDILPAVEIFTRWAVMGRLAEDGVEMRLKHRIVEFRANQVLCATDAGQVSIDADTFVLALGIGADPTLYEQLRNRPYPVIPVGDVNGARKVIHAIHEGYHAARRL
jgi:2,4-dienoyl-CoA reductase-like NADH-dependent reductase (Old Yellow Enzyme family)/thioredoxin reductase